MSHTAALSTASAGAPLKANTIKRRELRADDVLIDIAYAGICHSDIHQVREEWGSAIFPMVPGHEIAGTVSEIGDDVTAHKVGDRVGVGCMVDSCGECEYCKQDQEQFCTKGAVMTYNGKGFDGEETMGGYSQQVAVRDAFVVGIPDSIDLDVAAPLLCAGITTYSPLKRWGVGKGSKVAVVGMGGLGHVAVKFAVALGAEVTVLSRTTSKKDDSIKYGAVDHLSTSDESTFKDLASTFDVIINTVSANLPLDSYLATLKPNGAMVNVGGPSDPCQFSAFSLLAGGKVMAGTMIGGIAETQEMLEVAAKHGIGAEIEVISADEVNEAYDRVVNSDVRYRFVIDTATIKA